MTKEERREYDRLRYIAKKSKKSKKEKKNNKEIPKKVAEKSSHILLETDMMSAMKPNGKPMTIEEYCEFYGLDIDTVKESRLMTHRTPVSYNIQFHTREEIESSSFDLSILEREVTDMKNNLSVTKRADGSGIGVVNIADLHGGSYIDGLRCTPDYSIGVLVERLNEIAQRTNRMKYKEVHVHILGDLVESFSGLNHSNSWKGLQKGMHGVQIIKFMVKILHEEFLSKINNLASIKVVGGNHDRFHSDKNVDNEGGVAELICYGLELLEYDIEFDSMVINNVIDGVSYVLLHGDKGISKRKAKEIILDYGKQDLYNVILEAHLHSLIVKEDAHNSVRMHVRSLFTGNAYSEELGFTSTAGFTILENYGNGVPDMLNLTLR